jgi:hypothetical protein
MTFVLLNQVRICFVTEIKKKLIFRLKPLNFCGSSAEKHLTIFWLLPSDLLNILVNERYDSKNYNYKLI